MISEPAEPVLDEGRQEFARFALVEAVEVGEVVGLGELDNVGLIERKGDENGAA